MLTINEIKLSKVAYIADKGGAIGRFFFCEMCIELLIRFSAISEQASLMKCKCKINCKM